MGVIAHCGVIWCTCVWCMGLKWIEGVVVLGSLVLCLCVVSRCIVLVAFSFVCVLSAVDPCILYSQCAGIALQRINL